MFSEPAPIAEYIALVPPYEEVIVEQQRQVPVPLMVIENIRRIVDGAMLHPDVFTSPLFAGIMEGIQSTYNIIQEEPILQRRTKSHSPQK